MENISEKMEQVRKSAKDLNQAYVLAELDPETLSEKDIGFVNCEFKKIIKIADRENSPLSDYKAEFKEIADLIQMDS